MFKFIYVALFITMIVTLAVSLVMVVYWCWQLHLQHKEFMASLERRTRNMQIAVNDILDKD